MEDIKCKTSHRNLIISWLSKPFEKYQIWGQDEFVSLIEENQIKSYLYHPDMNMVRSVMQANEDKSSHQEISVADLYSDNAVDNDAILLPAAEIETKERRDGWYKYHVTDADVTKREDGITPLAMACYHGKCHIVHLLLNLLQHSPDVQSKDGTTPMMETVAAVSDDTEGRIQCIQELLRYGASAHIQNKTGHNVLTLAAYRGNVAILKELQGCSDSSLDWNHQTGKGHTPLMSAVYGENTPVLHYLITHCKVHPLVKNNEFFNAMDIALLMNAPAELIGLLAAYMSSEKHMQTYLKEQAEIVENIERKGVPSFDKCQKLELNFLCCLLSVAYLGCLPDVREGIFDNNLVDYLDQCSIWESVSPHLKTEFWLILAAHIFHDGDAKAMERLLDTTWAILQFHNESIYLAECEAYRLDRFMGILSFFLLAENGEEWIQFHFNFYPDLALKISDYEYADDHFARGFYKEILNLLKNFNIHKGLRLYERQKTGESYKDCEKSLRKRIKFIIPKVNSIIDFARTNHSELELKIKDLDKEKRSSLMKDKMAAFTAAESSLETAKADGKGDSPSNDETEVFDDIKAVTRQQRRRKKKAKARKLIAELRTKKMLECSLTENDGERCADAERCAEIKLDNPTTESIPITQEHKSANEDVKIKVKAEAERCANAKLDSSTAEFIPSIQEPQSTYDKDGKIKIQENENKRFEKTVTKTACSEKPDDSSKACVDREAVGGRMIKAGRNEESVRLCGTWQKSDNKGQNESTVQVEKEGNTPKRLEYIKTNIAPRFRRQTETSEKWKPAHLMEKIPRPSQHQKDVFNKKTITYPTDSHKKHVSDQTIPGGNEVMTTPEHNLNQIPKYRDTGKSCYNGKRAQHSTKSFKSVWDIVDETFAGVTKNKDTRRNNYKPEKPNKVLHVVDNNKQQHLAAVQNDKCTVIDEAKKANEVVQNTMLEKKTNTSKVNYNSLAHCTKDTAECKTDIRDMHQSMTGPNYDCEITPKVYQHIDPRETEQFVEDIKHDGRKDVNNQIQYTRMKDSHQPNPEVCQFVDISSTYNKNVMPSTTGELNFFDDPAIISIARPIRQKYEVDEASLKAKEFSPDEKQIPLVFPSASHDNLVNILKGYFPKTMLETDHNSHSEETEKQVVQNLSGSSESGYMSPPYQEDKVQNVTMFSRNWQRRSKRWRPLLSQLLSKPQNVIRVGTMNILFADDLHISKGSCGTVVRVGIRDDGLEVAVKCIVSSFKGLVQNELKALREIQHPNIVQYKDYVQDKYFAYIALELCEYTLEEYVVELMKSNMLHLHSRHLCLQLMTGLKALHDANILHMDLKPRNVLIDTNGNIRLTDFGLSHKLVGENSSFYHEAEYGTRCWRAPETISAMQSPGARGRSKKVTDVYVAGMILFFIHTGGRHPFEGNEEYPCDKKIMHGCSPDITMLPKDGIFINLLAKMLAHDMTKRINTDKALRHPFFWSDQRRLDFLVCLGHDAEVLGSMCSRLCPAEELYLRAQVTFIDRRLVTFMGWKREDVNSVHSILSRVLCDIDDRSNEIPRPIRDTIGEPSTYILSCFPNLLMGLYNSVIASAWTTRRGLRKYYYVKHH